MGATGYLFEQKSSGTSREGGLRSPLIFQRLLVFDVVSSSVFKDKRVSRDTFVKQDRHCRHCSLNGLTLLQLYRVRRTQADTTSKLARELYEHNECLVRASSL